MKLPFYTILGPILKSHVIQTAELCKLRCFYMSTVYTFLFGVLGFVISANQLKNRIGEVPSPIVRDLEKYIFLHDLKIIALSIALMQYVGVILGCLTENPVLFLPHLVGQLLFFSIKLVNNVALLLSQSRTWSDLRYSIPSVVLMSFNWCQEFCMFSKCLCVCDL